MARRLKTTVLVTAPPGKAQTFATFGPDDKDVPDWALEQMGDHCFEDEPDEPVRKSSASKSK